MYCFFVDPVTSGDRLSEVLAEFIQGLQRLKPVTDFCWGAGGCNAPRQNICKMEMITENRVEIPLLIWGQCADRWFCREQGSTKYKSIQESGSKFTTKYKSRESKMAAHYKIEIQDHKKPLKNGCLQNRLKKKLPLPSLENAQNRLDGACSDLYFVEKPKVAWDLVLPRSFWVAFCFIWLMVGGILWHYRVQVLEPPPLYKIEISAGPW